MPDCVETFYAGDIQRNKRVVPNNHSSAKRLVNCVKLPELGDLSENCSSLHTLFDFKPARALYHSGGTPFLHALAPRATTPWHQRSADRSKSG
jgi:hypothetical protein